MHTLLPFKRSAILIICHQMRLSEEWGHVNRHSRKGTAGGQYDSVYSNTGNPLFRRGPASKPSSSTACLGALAASPPSNPASTGDLAGLSAARPGVNPLRRPAGNNQLILATQVIPGKDQQSIPSWVGIPPRYPGSARIKRAFFVLSVSQLDFYPSIALQGRFREGGIDGMELAKPGRRHTFRGYALISQITNYRYSPCR